MIRVNFPCGRIAKYFKAIIIEHSLRVNLLLNILIEIEDSIESTSVVSFTGIIAK
jgi:hypothetical protein